MSTSDKKNCRLKKLFFQNVFSFSQISEFTPGQNYDCSIGDLALPFRLAVICYTLSELETANWRDDLQILPLFCFPESAQVSAKTASRHWPRTVLSFFPRQVDNFFLLFAEEILSWSLSATKRTLPKALAIMDLKWVFRLIWEKDRTENNLSIAAGFISIWVWLDNKMQLFWTPKYENKEYLFPKVDNLCSTLHPLQIPMLAARW